MASIRLAESALRRESHTPDARVVPLGWYECSAWFWPRGERTRLLLAESGVSVITVLLVAARSVNIFK
jgi:hypothetical protein